MTPSTIDAAAQRVRGTINVQTSAPSCTWSIANTAAWVTFQSAVSGTGNGTISYDIARNPGNVRSTTLTIAGKPVVVNQANGCAYSVSQESFGFGVDGGSGTVSVTTDGTCFWSASSTMTWVSIANGSEGKGAGSTTFTVAPNTGAPRNGYVVVAGVTVTISQAGSGGTLGAPAGVTATATSATRISVTWTPVGGATAYQVFRSSGSGYALVGSSASASYDDTSVAANTAYLYRVRAVNSTTSSPDSGADLATTVMFTDDPIAARVTVIRAVHMLELRAAVNAVRALAGLPPYAFTDAARPGVPLKAVHVEELRRAVDEAYRAMRLPTNVYAEPLLAGRFIRASHFQEIRNAVR